MHSSFIRYTFASGKHFSFIAGLCTVLCFMLWGGVAQAQQMRTVLAETVANSVTGVIPMSYTPSNSNTAIDATVNPNIADPDGSGPNVGVVDWVEVQIRVIANTESIPTVAPADAAAVSYASYIKPAWLLSDGSVVDVDSDIAAINAGTADPDLTIPTDTDGLSFDTGDQDLYILVNHRNHLPLMSAANIEEESGVYNLDFSGGDNLAVTGTTKLVGGRYVMYTGDSGGDGVINADDSNIVTLRPTDPIPGQFGSIRGYFTADHVFNGNVDTDDANRVNLRPTDPIAGNFGVGASRPIIY